MGFAQVPGMAVDTLDTEVSAPFLTQPRPPGGRLPAHFPRLQVRALCPETQQPWRGAHTSSSGSPWALESPRLESPVPKKY